VTPRTELDVDDIRSLLEDLGLRLQAQGVHATLYIVGGAAIALEMEVRRVTADVDAIFHPEATVEAVAAELATERGLRHDWLNQSARAFVPGGDSSAIALDIPGIAVALASPEHLLAMKMAAFRPTDVPDLELLFRHLDITNAEQAADLAIEVYGDASVVLPERDELLLSAQAVINRLRRESSGRETDPGPDRWSSEGPAT
jgi:predicted nucleotidyltransferase